jgi:menaquinone-dependent protoporphyrinogen oxidase
MSEILIAVASRHGHTGKIAARVAGVLRGQGHLVDVRDDVAASDPLPHHYDLVIAGASIHAGRHPAAFADWAQRHAVALNTMPSAFFSVCLAIADDTEEARVAADEYLDDFEDRTGWLPRLRTTFAGALQYREYGLPTRLLMQVKMRRGHHPADIGRDYDYTDWAAVDAFARDCAALLAPTTV